MEDLSKKNLTDRYQHKISVITVVYNDVSSIEKTINSVLSQTYNKIEYIIIDAGSTDGTLDVIKKYDLLIARWISEPDKGIYDGMNKGIRLSTGDIIYFLNSGDYLYDKDVIKHITNSYYTNDHPDAIYGDIIIYNPKNFEKFLVHYNNNKMNSLKSGDMLCHQAIFIKKDTLTKFGLFDLNYKLAADYDLLCKMHKNKCHTIYIDRIICLYNGNGLSAGEKKNVQKERKKIININYNILYSLLFIIKKITRKTIRDNLIKSDLLKYYHKLINKRTNRI